MEREELGRGHGTAGNAVLCQQAWPPAGDSHPHRQWLADALKENDPSNVILFLVGSKKDLSTPAQYSLMEKDALKVAQEMQAEYWAVSSLTGENVRDFFFRVAALTFESSVLAELERSHTRRIGDTVRISSNESDLYLSTPRKKPKCCQ
ncbi:RAB34, member RAS oncogene family [Pitangus sulphuratus]|nr:RAB34, member RAS oncogene family [Pitangus sulphuratus]